MWLPTTRVAVVALVGAVGWLGAAVVPPLAVVVVAVDAVVVALLVADLVLLSRAGPLRVRRVVAPVLSHHARNLVTLEVENRGPRAAQVRLVETMPPDVVPRRMELAGLVPPEGRLRLTYRITPLRRGRLEMAAGVMRVVSPLGLCQRQVEAASATETRVYPSVADVGRFELLARRSLLAEYGVRRARPAGGTEIEGVRDYVRGDDFRAIDWKVTARRQRPVSRELRPSRSQQVLLLFDAGRHMTEETGQGRRFDCAVNAALVLSHVAALHGDRVGVLAFGKTVTRYLQPQRGPGTTPAVARALYDVTPDLVEPDYGGAFRYLAARDRRRSLLIVFTEVVSEEVSDELCGHLVHAARRHLPVAVCLTNEELAGAAAARPRSARDAYERAAALELLDERQRALLALQRRGVQVVDVPPAQLQGALVSRYLSLKARLVI